MYGLYDKEGILRFVDSDKDACIAYAELFELGSTNYCLIDLAGNTNKQTKALKSNLTKTEQHSNLKLTVYPRLVLFLMLFI